MARRAKMTTLVPAPLREQLQAELVACGFSNYAPLTDWLNGELAREGLEVRLSVMAVNRYGQDYQKQFEAEMAEANQMLHIARQAIAQGEDSAGVVREATARVLQTRLLKLTTALRQAEESGDDVHKIAETTTKITRALADLGRMDIASQKYKQELEEAVYKARLSVLTELREFISRHNPGFKAAFAAVLTPFAEHLTRSPGGARGKGG